MKNYTSQVPVDRTISLIERELAKFGATNILKNYEAGEVTSISFTIFDPLSSKLILIKLPVKIKAVEDVLFKKYKRIRNSSIKKTRDQARRTAWRLVLDWVQVQLSMMEMNQAEMTQIFLPYIWDGQKTFYEALKENNFKALPTVEK